MKITYDTWDEESGVATVTIAGKFGQTTGTAKFNPNDKYKVKWDGYYIAYRRAITEYYKRKASALYQRYLGAKGFEHSLFAGLYNLKVEEINAIALHNITLQFLKDYTEAKEMYNYLDKSLKTDIQKAINDRIKFNDHLKKVLDKKEKKCE